MVKMSLLSRLRGHVKTYDKFEWLQDSAYVMTLRFLASSHAGKVAWFQWELY